MGGGHSSPQTNCCHLIPGSLGGGFVCDESNLHLADEDKTDGEH